MSVRTTCGMTPIIYDQYGNRWRHICLETLVTVDTARGPYLICRICDGRPPTA